MQSSIQRLTTEQEIDSILTENRAILYKHSTRCPLSLAAYHQVQKFLGEHPDAPLYLVDVIAHRVAARYAAAKVGIPHHSPQVIFLRDGVSVWDASHDRVTAREMTRHWDELRAEEL